MSKKQLNDFTQLDLDGFSLNDYQILPGGITSRRHFRANLERDGQLVGTVQSDGSDPAEEYRFYSVNIRLEEKFRRRAQFLFPNHTSANFNTLIDLMIEIESLRLFFFHNRRENERKFQAAASFFLSKERTAGGEILKKMIFIVDMSLLRDFERTINPGSILLFDGENFFAKNLF